MKNFKAFSGPLTAQEAATAMQAARLNALDLLDTAEILFSVRRLAHSVVFSTLAVEEAAVVSRVMWKIEGAASGSTLDVTTQHNPVPVRVTG